MAGRLGGGAGAGAANAIDSAGAIETTSREEAPPSRESKEADDEEPAQVVVLFMLAYTDNDGHTLRHP